MFKFKPQNPYWSEFSSYQTFNSIDEMTDILDKFVSIYDLTPAAKAVLNTIKLYSKRFIGVCWLYQEQIASKAGVSLSTVKRVIKGLKETGLLTVHEQIHTKRGGQTHNVYVINTDFVGSDLAENLPNELPSEGSEEPSKPCVPTVCESESKPHKNSHTNSNTKNNNLSIEKIDILRHVPNEFIDLMEPFYANNPEIILARWKTVCVAVKKSCISLSYTSWDTIGKAWKDVVKFYKRGKIKDSSDGGLGGYFYGVLCDYLMNDYVRNSQKMHAPL